MASFAIPFVVLVFGKASCINFMNLGNDILTPWGFKDLSFQDLVKLPWFTLSSKGALLASWDPLTFARATSLNDEVDDLEREIISTFDVGDLLKASRSSRPIFAYRLIVSLAFSKIFLSPALLSSPNRRLTVIRVSHVFVLFVHTILQSVCENF